MSCEGCYFGLLWGLCRFWALVKLVYFNFEWWCHECLNNSWDQKSFWNSRVALKRAFYLPPEGLIESPLMGLVQWALLKRAVPFSCRRGGLPMVHQ